MSCTFHPTGVMSARLVVNPVLRPCSVHAHCTGALDMGQIVCNVDSVQLL